MAYPKMGEITEKFVGQPYDLNSVLSPAKVWEKLDAQSEEVRVFTNSLIDLLNSTGEDNWLYAAIVNAILGQIADGSLTDVKLSDDAGQIKDRLTSFVATYDAFVATKGVANGIASLREDGRLPNSQGPSQLALLQSPGENVIFSVLESLANFETIMTKIREVELNITGSIRITFVMNVSNSSSTGTSQVYINGNPVGILRETTSTSDVSYTEDFDVNYGDLLQIYTKTTGSYAVNIKNLQIKNDIGVELTL